MDVLRYASVDDRDAVSAINRFSPAAYFLAWHWSHFVILGFEIPWWVPAIVRVDALWYASVDDRDAASAINRFSPVPLDSIPQILAWYWIHDVLSGFETPGFETEIV